MRKHILSLQQRFPLKVMRLGWFFTKAEKKELMEWTEEGFTWFEEQFGKIMHYKVSLFIKKHSFVNGIYRHKKRKITIKAVKEKELFISTLIHELAHWITVEMFKNTAHQEKHWDLLLDYRALIKEIYELDYTKAFMEHYKKEYPTLYIYYSREDESVARLIECLYLFNNANPEVLQRKKREFEIDTFLQTYQKKVHELMCLSVQSMDRKF